MTKNLLELAAKRTLAKITDLEETLKPLYLQPDRAIFLAANSGIILKVYVEGKTLELALPPLAPYWRSALAVE